MHGCKKKKIHIDFLDNRIIFFGILKFISDSLNQGLKNDL